MGAAGSEIILVVDSFVSPPTSPSLLPHSRNVFLRRKSTRYSTVVTTGAYPAVFGAVATVAAAPAIFTLGRGENENCMHGQSGNIQLSLK